MEAYLSQKQNDVAKLVEDDFEYIFISLISLSDESELKLKDSEQHFDEITYWKNITINNEFNKKSLKQSKMASQNHTLWISQHASVLEHQYAAISCMVTDESNTLLLIGTMEGEIAIFHLPTLSHVACTLSPPAAEPAIIQVRIFSINILYLFVFLVM